MIKTMSAKKLCALALVCLCVMLASPVLAGDPVGPVGPQIKGLQVGMPITPSEMTERLGYKEYERSTSENARNGLKQKKVRSKYGEVKIDVPQDRESSFEPKVGLAGS